MILASSSILVFKKLKLNSYQKNKRGDDRCWRFLFQPGISEKTET